MPTNSPAKPDPILAILRAALRMVEAGGIPIHKPISSHYSYPSARYGWGMWEILTFAVKKLDKKRGLNGIVNDGFGGWAANGAAWHFARAAGVGNITDWEANPRRARTQAITFLKRAIADLEGAA